MSEYEGGVQRKSDTLTFSAHRKTFGWHRCETEKVCDDRLLARASRQLSVNSLRESALSVDERVKSILQRAASLN